MQNCVKKILATPKKVINYSLIFAGVQLKSKIKQKLYFKKYG